VNKKHSGLTSAFKLWTCGLLRLAGGGKLVTLGTGRFAPNDSYRQRSAHGIVKGILPLLRRESRTGDLTIRVSSCNLRTFKQSAGPCLLNL
jgi:hypothetical protein